MTVPPLTESIPDFRTVRIGKSSRFSFPKDPVDQAWYAVTFGETLAAVLDVVSSGGMAPLLVEASRVLPDASGVGLFLGGGQSGQTYTIRIGVTTTGGDTLYRTVSLNVSDL